MPNPKFESVQTRREDKVRFYADRLARLLSEEKGVPVSRADAIAIAVKEAVERRKEP